MFPPELQWEAFRASNAEFGWTRSQIPQVVEVLRSRGTGILGGELWWVRDGITDWVGCISQPYGPPGVYQWETNRHSGEARPDFIAKGRRDCF